MKQGKVPINIGQSTFNSRTYKRYKGEYAVLLVSNDVCREAGWLVERVIEMDGSRRVLFLSSTFPREVITATTKKKKCNL